MQLKKDEIKQLDRKYRLNLINSITGIKPANLIGTKSKSGKDNLAIFSSVVHLGSNPAQIGMVFRPQTNGLKDTYANILETGCYTINHVAQSMIQKAHYTSAKLAKEVSEFEAVKLNPIFIDGFDAPFVEQSPVKIGMKYLHHFSLPNECIFMVGEVEIVDLPAAVVNDLGQINLEAMDVVGISGLNAYYQLKHTSSFPYVRTSEMPIFDEQ